MWLINTHNGVKDKGIRPIDINDYPAVKEHLDNYYPQLEKRQDKGDTPYNLRNCAYIDDFYKPKIVYSEIVREPQFYLDNTGRFFPEATTFLLIGDSLEYLYILLHSQPLTYFFKTFYAGGGLGESGYRYKKAFLEKLPIPKFTNTSIQNELIKLINEKPNLKNDNINKLIYQLYGLNKIEILKIEGD